MRSLVMSLRSHYLLITSLYIPNNSSNSLFLHGKTSRLQKFKKLKELQQNLVLHVSYMTVDNEGCVNKGQKT